MHALTKAHATQTMLLYGLYFQLQRVQLSTRNLEALFYHPYFLEMGYINSAILLFL